MRRISAKLWSGMMLLVAVVLIILWLFQIVFLDQFYTRIKISELISKGNTIVERLATSEDINTTVREVGLQEEMESLAYLQQLSLEVVDSSGQVLFQADNSNSMAGRGMMRNVNMEAYNIALSGKIAKLEAKHPRFGSKYMLIGLPVLKDGFVKGAVILNVPMAPVEDTAAILKQQLIWIIILLIGVSLLITYVLSRSFTKPILKLQKIAERYSGGEFDERVELLSQDELGELARSMNRMGEELAKNDRLRKDLVANVSHELRTPLSLIRGYAETLRDVTGENPEKREKQLGVIIEESIRLSKIVEDILSLSQYQAGAVRLDMKDFALMEMLEDILKRYELGSVDHKIEFVHPETAELYVKGDRGRLEQVLYNLINNAINHTEAGGNIILKVIDRPETVRLEVADDGEGIEKDELPYVFERYYTGNRAARKKHNGSGLGLAIVKSILSMHHIPFGVESSIGVGTTFWFELAKDNSHRSF